jgi:hypothetical protein
MKLLHKYMTVNSSKKNDPRYWKKWKESGAVGTIGTIETTMYQKMVALNPNRNPVFTAIENLSKPDEMMDFVDSCATHYRNNGECSDVRENPEATLKNNIGYVVGYYDPKNTDRWMSTIRDVANPMYGKNIPFTEPEIGYAIARK